MKKLFFSILVNALAGAFGAFLYIQYSDSEKQSLRSREKGIPQAMMAHNASSNAWDIPFQGQADPMSTSRDQSLLTSNINTDFVAASKKSTPSVVYIKTVSGAPQFSWFDLFFEGRSQQQVSSGSGVIFSKDGYIITNNHVIQEAEVIEVIYGRRSYQARLVGIDPSTDLAVIKIDEENLPAITMGSSEALEVGEWVLAVGNPFNLTSTVTAGIVSAKGRDINILRSKFPIESFIQTDAAINPGNSGGALVNIKGELIGINTAILSRTGSYTGYSFAVPSDLAKKVARDIIEYGVVQKVFIGAEVADIDRQLKEQLQLDTNDGLVIRYLHSGGAAEKAGLEKGDIITRINGKPITGRNTFEESLAYFYPGDKINVSVIRGDKQLSKNLTLTNIEGTTDVIRKRIYNSEPLGADFETVSKVERELLGIKNGIRVLKVRPGLMRRLGIQEDFIITKLNNRLIEEPEEFEEILTRIKGKIILEGINKRGVKGYYTFYF